MINYLDHGVCHFISIVLGVLEIYIHQGNIRSSVEMIASAGDDKSIILWSTSSGEQLYSLVGHVSEVSLIAIHPDGHQLASCSTDGDIIIWELNGYRQVANFPMHRTGVFQLIYSPDGSCLYASTRNKFVNAFNMSTLKTTSSVKLEQGAALSFLFKPLGEVLACGFGVLNQIFVWEVDSGSVYKRFGSHQKAIVAVEFNPTGSLLASSSMDGVVKVWDIEKEKELYSFLPCGCRPVMALQFSPCGQQLAVPGPNNSISFYSCQTFEVLRSSEGHSRAILDLSFNDCNQLASASMDGTVRLWTASTGECWKVLTGHSRAELVDIPDRGFAAFATRVFQPGDIICIEEPLVWVSGYHPFNSSQLEEIERKVRSLSEEDREALLNMANAFPEIMPFAAGVFMTNSFDMTDAPHGESCAMYCAIGRLNHSCNPNAQQTHMPDTGVEVLRATRCIDIGEEINDCYIELRQDRRARRKVLLELYRFNCECQVCAAGSAEDDKSRTRAAMLDGSIIEMASSDVGTALAMAEQYLQLLLDCSSVSKKKGPDSRVFQGWSDRYVAEAHAYVAQIASVTGKRKVARRHLIEAHAWNCKLQGDSSPDSRHSAELLQGES